MQLDTRDRSRDRLVSCILLEARGKYEEEFFHLEGSLGQGQLNSVPGSAAARSAVQLFKPPDFKPPSADSLVQIAQTEKGSSEVSCVIDQDNQGFLKAPPMIHTDDSRPSGFTFAHVAVQTAKHESEDSLEVLTWDACKLLLLRRVFGLSEEASVGPLLEEALSPCQATFVTTREEWRQLLSLHLLPIEIPTKHPLWSLHQHRITDSTG